MAASYSDLGKIASDAAFQQRVDYAMTNAALAIYSEVGSTAGHPTRAQFAKQVLSGGYDQRRAALGVLENATIAAEANIALPVGTPSYSIPDSDIQFAVNSMWNAFAGA